MNDPLRPAPQRPDPDPAGLAAMNARHARRRRRAEAGLDVPETWDGFSDTLRGLFADAGLVGATGGLEAARLWSYLRRQMPEPCSLDDALDAGFLLDLNAEAVGRALDALRQAELVMGTAEGFVLLNPVTPF